jgi:DNA-binding cell septation regulator SpoVG
MATGSKVMATKKEKWDGRSRPSNKAYDEGYARIFNPVAKEVRTSKFKSQVIKNKKKEDYFDSKSVKQMMDEME